MSQADFHSDSSSSAAIPASDGTSVPPPPPNQVPPPPPPGANKPPAPNSAPQIPSGVVPPPPPPQATKPPVRPAPQPRQPGARSDGGQTAGATPTGVGSAKGVRWRGELAGVDKEVEKEQGKKARTRTSATTNRAAVPSDQEDEDELNEKITREAPPWLVSMVFHLVLLLVLALMGTPVGTDLGKMMLTIGHADKQDESKFTDFDVISQISVDDAESLEDAEVDVDIPTMLESTLMEQSLEVEPVDMGAGELAVVKPMFNGRTGAMRQALLAIYGGTPETQNAVARGLEWLKRNQRRDGSWSMRGPYDDGGVTENTVAATAMALLAFLGDGNTHKSGDYQEQVDKGIQYLISKQDRSGFFAKQAREHEKMYAQAQATIAICELYAMTKDSWLRPRAQLAVDFAHESQSEEGGWRYEPKFDSDTSVTGWFVMALQSARSGGLVVNDSIFRFVDSYLDSASSYEKAAYGYQAHGEPSPAMTAEGILCRQYISWDRNHPAMFRGLNALLLDAPFDINDRDVYYWYYATQAMHHFGGSPWREWNERMRVQLPKAQVIGGQEDGSWSPQQDRWGRNSGRLYTTCLSLYCLEVYYRHMPLYKAEGSIE